MAISPQEFRNALSTFASGVTVVTTADEDGALYGLTVSAFCSVSLEPPLILVSIEKSARCHDVFAETGRFAVNILAEDQREISERFATQLEDKFHGIRHSQLDSGMPSLDGCVAILDCRVEHTYAGGDHTIFVALVEETEVSGGGPLLYAEGRYGRIGY